MKPSIRQRALGRLDERLNAIGPADRFTPPPKGWVRAIRDAIGMTGVQFARRLGVTPQAVSALERSEANGTIQIDKLRRAAEAMDCTLIYAIAPRQSLEAMVDQRARAIALSALRRVSHSMALEDQRVDRDFEARVQNFIDTALRDRDLWEGA